MLETSGLTVQADNETDGVTKVSMLLECLHDRQLEVDNLAESKRLKLDQRVQLLQFDNEANQVSLFWSKKYQVAFMTSYTKLNTHNLIGFTSLIF